eukprot:2848625-Pleurochrysis_carterae.AAC.3
MTWGVRWRLVAHRQNNNRSGEGLDHTTIIVKVLRLRHWSAWQALLAHYNAPLPTAEPPHLCGEQSLRFKPHVRPAYDAGLKLPRI